jgi:uncharacterized protein YndB with AHSA1/START domain
MDGQLERIDGRSRLRFVRRLPHPPQKVWRALTEDEHLAKWFPTTIEGERAAGAPLRFSFRGDDLPSFEGKLIVYEPPSVLEFLWGDDTIRIELVPDGDGCVLTLLDTLDVHGKAARDAAGWHECLDLLASDLAGKAPDFKPGEHWAEVHPRYVERFGPEASSIGPPERRPN